MKIFTALVILSFLVIALNWTIARRESKEEIEEKKQKRLALNTAIGNVLDHWEQLPNDLRLDPGFESLDHALRALYQVQAEREREEKLGA